MLNWGVVVSVLVGIVIFLFGLENFSNEIKKIAGERFNRFLQRAVSNRFTAALSGFFVTAVLQSSTATTLITVSLINAGFISFYQSLGIIFGSNIGSTVTAQLVALKLTFFAPFFVIIGFVIGLVGGKYKYIGKGMFYFGLVFFGLSIMSLAVEPLKNDPSALYYFGKLSNVFIAILAGFVITALTNSSAVTIGMIIVLSGAGMISLGQGIPVLLGANLGTTLTTIIASLRLNLHAKRAAVAHLMFNVFGVILLLPFLGVFTNFIASLGGNVGQQIANAHTIFNVLAAVLFLFVLNPFKRIIDAIVPGKEEEILLKPKYLKEIPPASTSAAFSEFEKEIKYIMETDYKMFELSKCLLKNDNSKSASRLESFGMLSDRLALAINRSLLKISWRKLSEVEARKVLYLVRMANTLEQLGDIAEDLGSLQRKMAERGITDISSSTKEVEPLYQRFESAFRELELCFPDKMPNHARAITERGRIEPLINRKYRSYVPLLKIEKQYSGSVFIEAVSLLESSISKLREAIVLAQYYAKLGKKK